MALRYLVDTSVIKRIAAPAIRDAIEPMALAGELARATICDLEVGFSARNAQEWDQLLGALDAFVPVMTTSDHVRRASGPADAR